MSKIVPLEQKGVAVTDGDIMENVLIKGDLSKLTPQERSTYYMRVCESAGLNPLTQPFAYITLNGKLTLYALRACTDQLRTIHKVSVEELTESERDGVFIVTAKVKNADGRTDMAKGAVPIHNIKGDVLANALMKAETKAKRRATLSICGLGFLDETEIETIPAAGKKLPPHDPETGEIMEGQIIDPAQAENLKSIIVNVGANLEAFLKYFEISAIEHLPLAKLKTAMDMLAKKIKPKAKS